MGVSPPFLRTYKDSGALMQARESLVSSLTPEAQTRVRVFKRAHAPVHDLIPATMKASNVAEGSNDMVQVVILGQAVKDITVPSVRLRANNIPIDYGVIELGKKVTANTYLEVGGEVRWRVRSVTAAQAEVCPLAPLQPKAAAMYNGAGIMLCEVRNQGTQKAMGMQIKILQKTMWETFRAFATESIYDVDVSLYDEIPIQQRVGNPHS